MGYDYGVIKCQSYYKMGFSTGKLKLNTFTSMLQFEIFKNFQMIFADSKFIGGF